MDWLIPSVISALLGTLILAFSYGYLFAVYRERFMGIWTFAWVFYALRFMGQLVMLQIGSGPLLLGGGSFFH